MKQGDIVTRDGTDEHLVYDINDAGDLIDVVCIKEPNSKWIKYGETESNLTRRYNLIAHLINWKNEILKLKDNGFLTGA